jgi:uncharacterized membrane protein YraQ (UPF0718 family)
LSSLILRWFPPFLTVCCLIMLMLIFTSTRGTDLSTAAAFILSFKTLFLGILLEAFPFILLGVLFSAVLQVFVSDALVQRFIPRNPTAGIIFGSLLGLLFPICECGMIPVVRRLIGKGMPPYIGIVYILAGPIINPVVFVSTWVAFRGYPEIAYLRIGLAFAVSVIAGLILIRFLRSDPMRRKSGAAPARNSHLHDRLHHDHHGHNHDHDYHLSGGGWKSRMTSVMAHATEEFFEMGKYLIFGAFLTACIQTSVSGATLAALGENPWVSPVFMMGFAFLLSLCSTSDAFVAAPFAGTFGTGPILAFLVFGPMIDVKSTLMLLSTFRTKVVAAIVVITAILVLSGSILIGQLLK